MVTQATDLDARIEDFIARLRQAVSVDVVVLFGSQADGRATEDSDIDVAVFSRDFNGKTTWERQEVIARATVGRAYRISPVGFSMDEYGATKRSSFVSEVLRTGKQVSPK